MILGMNSGVFQILGEMDSEGAFVFTCEHASNALPDGVRPSRSDLDLLQQHWGWDIGARDVVEELVSQLGGQAVLSTFSRLWVDPNRAPGAEALIVAEIDGQPVEFNRGIDRSRDGQVYLERIRDYYNPYHQAIDRIAAARSKRPTPFQLLSVHSFTPMYLGNPRPMEVGVLFNEHDECAWHMEEALSSQGFETVLNAPYSGKPPQRLIYSAERHGQAHGVTYLELEIRQDLIDEPHKAAEVGQRIAAALKAYLVLSAARA